MTYGSMGHLEAIAARRDAEDERWRLTTAATEVLRCYDAWVEAVNGNGHPGESHDRAIHIDPCTNLPGVEHVYSTSTDCAACGGAEYGTEDDLHTAYAHLRDALGQPRKPWEEHIR